ncbi:heterodisulfide reductase-related iron-sulfur binding cluster [Psychrilyobacter sp.]|uniref:heterodisulfide reductase-related iron-sulfur binding cluster n=1 Tax=Psychrilyobacter sp. TaxID=2586924 RepID=UPI003015B030
MVSKKIKEKMEEVINGCLECKSKPCMKNCVMLNDFGEDPKSIFKECIEKNKVSDRMTYSCNMCNQCTIACPKDYKIQDIFMESRKLKIEKNNGKSPMKGHRAIEVHQYLGHSNFFNTANKAPKGNKTKRIFFPGCSLPSYNSKAVGNILDFLQEKYDGEIGSILKCCGKPTQSLGQVDKFKKRYDAVQKAIDDTGADEIIVACQSCYEIFKKNSPNQKVKSLWEILPQLGLPEHANGIGKDSNVVFGIHDSCPTRYNKEIQNGIRWILAQMEYKTEEPFHTKENTRCCGFGGMVMPANPKVTHAVRNRRASEYKTDHIVSYCAACRESMESAGKDSVHILDLVFGETYTKASAAKRNQRPEIQWMNRFKSKKELNKRK